MTTVRAPGLGHSDGLTALRFPASIGVLLFHIVSLLLVFPALQALATTGYIGVSFFFCLSGFVLTLGADKRLTACLPFYRNRLARIYPTHILYWVLFLGLTEIQHPDLIANAWHNFYLGLGLLQAWAGRETTATSFNAPSWSLSCEAAFYLSFPLILRNLPKRIPDPRKAASTLFLIMLVLGVVIRIVVGVSQGATAAINPVGWIYFFPPYRFFEFLLGMVLARSVRTGWRPPGGVPVALIAVGIGIGIIAVSDTGLAAVTVAHTLVPADLGDLLMILPFGWLIAAVAVSDRRAVPRSLIVLGRWSFAIYMCQDVVIQTLVRWLPQQRHGLTGLVDVFVAVVAVVVLAAVTYVAFEKPLEAKIRGSGRRPHRPVLTTHPRPSLQLLTRTGAPPDSRMPEDVDRQLAA